MMKCWEVTCDGLAYHPGVVAILLVASCYGNQDKLWLCGPLGLCARQENHLVESTCCKVAFRFDFVTEIVSFYHYILDLRRSCV